MVIGFMRFLSLKRIYLIKMGKRVAPDITIKDLRMKNSCFFTDKGHATIDVM